MISFKKSGISGHHVTKNLVEGWSTSKPCISVIYQPDFIGPTATCSPGLSQQIKCNFINLNICHFFAILLFLTLLVYMDKFASIRKMADAQQCVLRQYTIQVNKLVDFDRQISEGW